MGCNSYMLQLAFFKRNSVVFIFTLYSIIMSGHKIQYGSSVLVYDPHGVFADPISPNNYREAHDGHFIKNL